MRYVLRFLALASLSAAPVQAQVKIVTERLKPAEATSAFQFKSIPAPQKNDAAAQATFAILEGENDANGAGLSALSDGKLPDEIDDPAHNFFFARGDGGRLLLDLGKVTEVAQVRSYSWHPGARAPQVYRLYGSDGSGDGFSARPAHGSDPALAGWKLLASVDTKPSEGPPGGQYAVSISDGTGSLGRFRYLLFEVANPQIGNPQSNTFWSEIDVVDRSATEPVIQAGSTAELIEIPGSEYRFALDVSETPELAEWARRVLVPVVQDWYPKLVVMLPSEGFTAPRRFSITFRKNMDGVAVTVGTRIYGAAKWYGQNLKGEALGSIVHELVHVVQQYRGGGQPPGWLIEGIPDEIRFYLYEPQAHGAGLRPEQAEGAMYNGSYRVSANFLHWVTGKYCKELIARLNAALRTGTYQSHLWQELTGHSVEQLAAEWKQAIAAGETRE